ncbi:sensor histidine kinase [Oerskovia flava]|uniref:sensor histidine kinase n=1 Tax=Oerskovia flava TaxID=2986422 RepID=UPI00223F2251|nr:sensor histidine kinase [Oerskovia sp. JB1-3-2]
MTTAERPAAEGSALETIDGTWSRDVVWWDVAFYVIVALSALALFTAGITGTARTVTLLVLGVIMLAYALVGRRAARSRDQRLAVTYLVVLVTGTLVIITQAPLNTLLLFVAFTQVWMLSERLVVSVAFCVVLALGTAGALAWDDGIDLERFWLVLPEMGVVLAFALGLGVWVAHALRQSEKHARLVDELHATQSELARSHHSAGVAAERERMAREIHDTLAQGFTSVVMLSQAAVADLDRGASGEARARLELVEATARDNLAEARSLVAAFAPVPLQDGSLADALTRLARRFEEETGVRVRLDLDVTPGAGGRLSSAQEVVVLRSAQEALANVRRHAEARSVSLTLDAQGTSVCLAVVDDGRGIAPDSAEGFGLRGMRERVAASGGDVRVEPVPDGGTAVRVQLPADRRTA